MTHTLTNINILYMALKHNLYLDPFHDKQLKFSGGSTLTNANHMPHPKGPYIFSFDIQNVNASGVHAPPYEKSWIHQHNSQMT